MTASLNKKTLHHVIRRPHVTEKSSVATGGGVYTFEVAVNTTKDDVARAVKELYKVTPIRVRTVTVHPKKVSARRGRPGLTGTKKKALVYLKKGDTIEFS